MTGLHHMRQNYSRSELLEEHAPQNPMDLFQKWFDEASQDPEDSREANAMTLGTVNEHNEPEARTVLLKEFSEQGFVFFTNYTSQKGRSLAQNPNACLLFFWPALQRQVRINGVTSKLSAERSAQYFQSRPTGSQIGAWASPQSQPVTRQDLEERLKHYQDLYEDKVPTPDFWGGYNLAPSRIEFWQGRPSRMHDRLRYVLNEDSWQIVRLAP